jgi:peptide/nickel transport system substrate-binding protein
MVMVAQVEPTTISSKVLQTTGGLAIGATQRLFNATLTTSNGRGLPIPYLVDALPELNTDTWKIFPDGRMETTYHLRAGLVWQDGAPLTSDDVVFSWKLLSHPEIGEAKSRPQVFMQEAVATDPQTVVIRWARPFRDAAEIGNDFPPFPKHILGDALDTQPEQISSRPFWTSEYVGLGPFKLSRWEPGAFIEASAFDKHVTGRAKIDRIKILFSPDANTALAYLLAGEAHVSLDDAIRFEQGLVLERAWKPNKGGTVLSFPDQWRRNEIQHRPEYASPAAILDVRVRKALSHTVDKDALNQLDFEGEGLLTESVIPPTMDYFSVVDAAAVKYPFDPRKAEELMNQAGFGKDSQGFYSSPTEGRFTWEIKTNAGAQSEDEVAFLSDAWRRAGFDFHVAVNPAALSRDGEVRAAFPTMFGGGGPVGEDALVRFVSSEIPTPNNRWIGQNRGGYSSPEFDRLAAVFNAEVNRAARGPEIAELVHAITDQVGAMSLYFNPGILAHISAIKGPQVAAPGAARDWNVQDWEWTSN